MNERQSSSEPQINPDHKIYYEPHLINIKIRNLKKEYNNPQILPGAERKIEIQEEYEKLKSDRIKTRALVLKDLEKYPEGKIGFRNTLEEKMANAQRDFERGQVDDNYVLKNRAKEQWETYNDLYQLLEQNDKNWQDIEFKDEDEGFELGELKSLK